MQTIRSLATLVVALGLLVVLGTTAWAVDVDLTVKTSDDTNLSQLMFRVGTVDAVIDGADAQTGAILDLNGLTADAAQTLITTYGDFSFSVASDGTLTVPSGLPIVASGSTMTIQNTVDLPDLEVRMRNTTGLSVVRLQPTLLRSYVPSFTYATRFDLTIDLEGGDADTPASMRLLGLVPGALVRLGNNLGPTIDLNVAATGAVTQASTSDVTIAVPSSDLIIIENDIDLTGFSVMTKYETTLATVGYKVLDFRGPGYYTPTSLSTGPNTFAYGGVTTRTGSTSHTNAATFDLSGLVPGQLVTVTSAWGAVGYEVQSDGTLEETSSSMDVVVSTGYGLEIDNWVNIQNFRIRAQNPVNSDQVRLHVESWSNYSTVHGPGVLGWTTGADADDGLSVPLRGLTPGLGFYATTSLGWVNWRVTDVGTLEAPPEQNPAPRDGVITVDPTSGDVTVTMLNSRELWVKLYGASAAPSTMPGIAYHLWLWGGGNLDDSYRGRDSVDFVDGETFHVAYVGNRSLITGSIVVYPPDGAASGRVTAQIQARLDPSGTATFTGPSGIVNVSPTRGALTIELDGVPNTFYVELVEPPNEAPTVTLEDGENITILSSAQSMTTLTAYVDDDDDDTLSCSWYVDDVLVAGPSAPTAGESELDLGDLDDLGTGSHTIRVEVSDGTDTASAEIVVTVDNSPPDVAVGGAGVYEIDDDVDVTLTAEVSDYDGDDLTYAWTAADGTVLVSGTVETTSGGSPASVPDWAVATTSLGTGTHVLTLTVEDEDETAVETPVTVEVADTTGPVLAPVADDYLLWPPNHSMVEVVIDANAYDASGGSVTLDVTVESSEPPEFDSDGDFLPDHEVVSVNQSTGEITLDLRAERSGKGDGRVYTVTITATDASDNVSTTTVEVVCPHDKRR